MALTNITFNLNGKDVSVDVECSDSLLNVLRNQLHITSLKSACVMGECGACTIIIDGKAMNSCLVLAPTAHGKRIETLESLGTSRNLHPIQKAFKDVGAFQCGFCTPGFVMSTKALLDKNPNPTREDVEVALSGNICRCTGYVKPIEGALKAAEVLREKNRVDAVLKAAEVIRKEQDSDV